MENFLKILQDNLSLIVTGLLVSLPVLLLLYGLMVKFQLQREDVSEGAGDNHQNKEKKPVNPTPISQLSMDKNALDAAISQLNQKTSGEKDHSIELSLLGYQLQRARQAVRDRELPDTIRENFDNILEAGKNAMNEERWDAARKYFEEALKLAPEESEVLIVLAIVCYEQADLPASEKYYQEAIKKNHHAGNLFRKHLAFRVYE